VENDEGNEEVEVVEILDNVEEVEEVDVDDISLSVVYEENEPHYYKRGWPNDTAQ